MSLLSNNEYKLTEYAAETMIYFEKHKLIEIAKVKQEFLKSITSLLNISLFNRKSSSNALCKDLQIPNNG